ncbi:hypothetical protein NEUTE2DRAFT_57054 [Neurospora tetrasperma FGSC 2509]|nr:hypothetical protein NEUTE2DRAFT_57054 [Neurospora tetrasperma FGSC 2509]
MLPTTDAGGGVPQSDRVPWLRISETSAPCPPVPASSKWKRHCVSRKGTTLERSRIKQHGGVWISKLPTSKRVVPVPGRAVITIGYYRLQVAREIKQGTDVNEFDNAALLLTTEGNLSRAKARASATMISGMVVRTLEGRCLDVKCQICPITSPRSICSRSSQSWEGSFVGQGGDRIGGPHAKAPALSCKWKCET